ncbi:hypothetical protein DB345_15325 [Spartobacteria bacterium LR76]|nr:hypothetical protein DB345_15325 [Spartobacteria bacterium LR76]
MGENPKGNPCLRTSDMLTASQPAARVLESNQPYQLTKKAYRHCPKKQSAEKVGRRNGNAGFRPRTGGIRTRGQPRIAPGLLYL